MRLLSPELVLVAVAAVGWAPPMPAQQAREIGVHALATASDPGLVVGALYAALRPSTRTRVSVSAGAGISSGEAAVRGELLGHFLLSPNKLAGTGLYFAGGVAVVAGPVERGYLVLTLGIEDRPGGASGWMAELGVGGGARVALGYRWRGRRQPALP
jgi:hypothetical protein